MRFGSPLAAGFGSPENAIAYAFFEKAADETSVLFRFMPRTGWGDCYFGVYRNAVHFRNVYAVEGEEQRVRVPVPWGATQMSIRALRIGQIADPAYSCPEVLRVYEAETAARVTLSLTYTPKAIEPLLNDGGYTSGWTFTGLERGRNCSVVDGHLTWGRLRLDLTVSGGSVTATLSMGGVTVAEGTAAVDVVPFAATLLEVDGSGLAAACTIDPLVATVSNAELDIRWPAELIILREGADPPTVEVARVTYPGVNTLRWTDPDELAAGTYYYRDQPVSDTGDEGTQSASVSATIPGPPLPVSNLARASGTAANLVLSFTASLTAGATYRLYLSNPIGGQMNLDSPSATAAAGATTIAAPAITGYPGVVYAIVRAVSAAGVEEKSLNTLALEFDAAGAFVAARPNAPQLLAPTVAVTAGRTLAVRATYDPRREAAVAATVNLYSRTPAGAYNFAAPDASAALGSAGPSGAKAASLSYTFAANGYYYVTVLAATAGGVLSDSTLAGEVLVFVSDADLPADAALTAAVSRG